VQQSTVYARFGKPVSRKSYGDLIYEAMQQPDMLDCASGNNPYGTSPKALRAFTTQRDVLLNSYPTKKAPALAAAIARRWNNVSDLKPEEIIVTASGDAALQLFNKAFLSPGDDVVGYVPQYPEYLLELRAVSANYVTVEEIPYFGGSRHGQGQAGEDELVSAIIRACRRQPAAVFIDSPNNPTGQVLSLGGIAKVAKAVEAVPCPVMVDEAYGDTVADEDSAITLQRDHPNIVVCRTLSKGYGLAGMRVGYLAAVKEYGNRLSSCSLPYPIGRLDEEVACAAIGDSEFLVRNRVRVRQDNDRLARVIGSCRYLFMVNTHPQTVLALLGTRIEGVDLFSHLRDHGLVTAPGKYFKGLDARYVRLRIPENIQEFAARLKDADRALG